MKDSKSAEAPDPVPVETDFLVPGLIHELRQPLMGVQAGLTLLARRLGETLTRAEEWDLVTAQLARLEELARGYEELVRPQAIAPAALAVEPVVSRAIDLLAYRVRPLRSRFIFSRGGGDVGYGAASALLHATTNLLANGLDAVEECGGDAARLELRILPGSPVQIRVSDEGRGVPAELQGRIFEPRFTTKPRGKGTGLGLHVARRLMARCGGGVFLVPPDDPRRLPWARTEFCIELARAPQGGSL